MKNKIALLSIVALTLGAGMMSAHAQTSTLTETNSSGGTTTVSAPQNFLQTIEAYATSENTNYTWISNRLEIATGEKTYNQVSVSSYLDANVNINDSWSVVAEVDNAGVAGIVQSVEAGAGYAVVNQHDLKINAEVIGGYNLTDRAGEVEPRIMARKKLTPHTFAEAGIGIPEEFKGKLNEDPSVYVGAGCTF